MFAAFVLATKKERSISDWILVACLMTIALKFILYLVHQQHAEFFDLQFSMGLIPLTFGAYLYLYTVYLTEGYRKFRLKDLLHALPVVLLMAMYFTFFKGEVDFTDTGYFSNDDYLSVRIVFGLIVFTSIIVYTVITFMRLRDFRKSLVEQYSYENRDLSLLWLNFIFILFMILFATHFITGGINAVSYAKVIDTETLSHFGLTVIAFVVSYFALQQKAVHSSSNGEQVNGQSQRAELAPGQVTNDKEETEKLNNHLSRLNKHMSEAKPYLNPELTLSDLASQIGMNKGTLTQLLNHHLGKNFFTYVNEYRLEAVIEKFDDPANDHFTIMAIALDCGFNSKSTFNSLFKKYTGKTPSEYKRSERKS